MDPCVEFIKGRSSFCCDFFLDSLVSLLFGFVAFLLLVLFVEVVEEEEEDL